MSTIPPVSPELPDPTWRLVLRMLGRLPARAMSRSFGRVADLPLAPAFRAPILGSFARAVGIDLSEAEKPLDAYTSLNDFFVRRLRQGARTWPTDPDVPCSPVDGVVGQLGQVTRGRAIQAKGHDYTVADLLGSDPAAEPFLDGSFLTIYLSPRHYHRIHTPAAGTISEARYIPGSLYPVNAPAVMHIPHLFARNERLVAHLSSASGIITVVAVGAYNVGRISAAFDPEWSGRRDQPWVTNRKSPAPLTRHYDPPIEIAAGSEIMAFHLGSTVVLLFEPGVTLRPDLRPGLEVRVGEPLRS